MTFMEQPCRECGQPVVMTAYGPGHLRNPRNLHHPARAALRAEERHDSVVVSTAPGLRADKRSSALSASRSAAGAGNE